MLKHYLPSGLSTPFLFKTICLSPSKMLSLGFLLMLVTLQVYISRSTADHSSEGSMDIGCLSQCVKGISPISLRLTGNSVYVRKYCRQICGLEMGSVRTTIRARKMQQKSVKSSCCKYVRKYECSTSYCVRPTIRPTIRPYPSLLPCRNFLERALNRIAPTYPCH